MIILLLLILIGVFSKNKHNIETIVGVIASEKNDILYGTINKSLSISFDQDLCNISDNLKIVPITLLTMNLNRTLTNYHGTRTNKSNSSS